MKICFITEDFYPNFIGGQGVYGYHLVKNLAKLGHEVTILAEKRGERDRFWRDFKYIKLYLVPFCFGNQLILAFLEYFYFKKNLSKQYFDIVHANQLSGLFFVLLRPKNVGKIIVSAHNTNYDMAQKTDSGLKWILYQMLIWLEKIVYKRADGLLFNSEDEETDLKKYYKIENPVKSINPGVDIPKITQNEKQKAREKIRGDLGVKKNQKIILYVGRLVKRKKVNTLIQAVSLIKSVKLLIIGRGVERKNLEKIAGSNVEFLGFIDDTRSYFLASDCFVAVSVAEGGFLLSSLEAASFGLPLILSPSAAGFPIIKEGENGYIIEPDNPKLLADKIKIVLKSSRQMGEESRKIVRQFSWEKCTRKTLDFYRFLLKS